jgi:biotin carboxyl carrier protein
MIEISLGAEERVHVPLRLVVAPSAGMFHPPTTGELATEGDHVTTGQAIGVVELSGTTTPVCSPFTGHLMGVLVAPGEKIRAGQPVAWLRSA